LVNNSSPSKTFAPFSQFIQVQQDRIRSISSIMANFITPHPGIQPYPAHFPGYDANQEGPLLEPNQPGGHRCDCWNRCHCDIPDPGAGANSQNGHCAWVAGAPAAGDGQVNGRRRGTGRDRGVARGRGRPSGRGRGGAARGGARPANATHQMATRKKSTKAKPSRKRTVTRGTGCDIPGCKGKRSGTV
jgi:hypothetical protein